MPQSNGSFAAATITDGQTDIASGVTESVRDKRRSDHERRTVAVAYPRRLQTPPATVAFADRRFPVRDCICRCRLSQGRRRGGSGAPTRPGAVRVSIECYGHAVAASPGVLAARDTLLAPHAFGCARQRQRNRCLSRLRLVYSCDTTSQAQRPPPEPADTRPWSLQVAGLSAGTTSDGICAIATGNWRCRLATPSCGRASASGCPVPVVHAGCYDVVALTR